MKNEIKALFISQKRKWDKKKAFSKNFLIPLITSASMLTAYSLVPPAWIAIQTFLSLLGGFFLMEGLVKYIEFSKMRYLDSDKDTYENVLKDLEENNQSAKKNKKELRLELKKEVSQTNINNENNKINSFTNSSKLYEQINGHIVENEQYLKESNNVRLLKNYIENLNNINFSMEDYELKDKEIAKVLNGILDNIKEEISFEIEKKDTQFKIVQENIKTMTYK